MRLFTRTSRRCSCNLTGKQQQCVREAKHLDLRAHFVRDTIKDQVIEINFVKSAENDSDIMTKNQQGQHYLYAKSKFVYTVQEMNEKEGH